MLDVSKKMKRSQRNASPIIIAIRGLLDLQMSLDIFQVISSLDLK